MNWFEKNGFRKKSENSWNRKIACNNVRLHWQDETDPYQPNKWYCVVEGHGGFYADTKEDALAGALDNFEKRLSFEKRKLEERIAEIDNARTLAINNKGAEQ